MCAQVTVSSGMAAVLFHSPNRWQYWPDMNDCLLGEHRGLLQ